MKTEKMTRILKDLVQVDIDTFHIYNRALEYVMDDVLKSRLTEFRDCHLEHVNILSSEIELLGDSPTTLLKNLKGHLLEAVAALFTSSDTEGALTTLKKAEEKANRYYGEAVSKDFPGTIKEKLRTHFSEEKIHLGYITENLKVLD